jgi:hypothetical protein
MLNRPIATAAAPVFGPMKVACLGVADRAFLGLPRKN